MFYFYIFYHGINDVSFLRFLIFYQGINDVSPLSFFAEWLYLFHLSTAYVDLWLQLTAIDAWRNESVFSESIRWNVDKMREHMKWNKWGSRQRNKHDTQTINLLAG